jgi:hypothetical protein
MVWEQLRVLFSFTLQTSKWHIYIVLSKDGIYIFTSIAIVDPLVQIFCLAQFLHMVFQLKRQPKQKKQNNKYQN